MKLSELKFTKNKDHLEKRLAPKLKKIAKRFRFNKRDKKAHESLNDYVVELKQFTQYCSYVNHLKEALLDRFVVGVKDEDIKKWLLSEPDTLTFEGAVNIVINEKSR